MNTRAKIRPIGEEKFKPPMQVDWDRVATILDEQGSAVLEKRRAANSPPRVTQATMAFAAAS